MGWRIIIELDGFARGLSVLRLKNEICHYNVPAQYGRDADDRVSGCRIVGTPPQIQDYIENSHWTEISNGSRSFVRRMRFSIEVPLWMKGEMQKTAY